MKRAGEENFKQSLPRNEVIALLAVERNVSGGGGGGDDDDDNGDDENDKVGEDDGTARRETH